MDPWLCLDLFWRFLLVSLLAFGGGQAALPLVERGCHEACGEHFHQPVSLPRPGRPFDGADRQG